MLRTCAVRRMCAAYAGAPGSSWRHVTSRSYSVFWCSRTCRSTWTQASTRFMRARRPSQTASTPSSSCTTCFRTCPQTLLLARCPRKCLSSYLLRWITQPSHTQCSTQGYASRSFGTCARSNCSAPLSLSGSASIATQAQRSAVRGVTEYALESTLRGRMCQQMAPGSALCNAVPIHRAPCLSTRFAWW